MTATPKEPSTALAREVRRRSLLLVLSSPSGAGKTTISRALLQRDEQLVMSVSMTTRAMRPGEVAGRDYLFVDVRTFEGVAASGGLLEHALVHDHRYGTPRAAVEQAVGEGRDVLFDVDWQGAQQLRQALRHDLVSVFILPPSPEELARRLRTRAQDSDAVVARRLSRAADEMSHWAEYDYVVINHDIGESVRRVEAILTAERLRRERQIGLTDFVRRMREGG
jgi:guanylate kinase